MHTPSFARTQAVINALRDPSSKVQKLGAAGGAETKPCGLRLLLAKRGKGDMYSCVCVLSKSLNRVFLRSESRTGAVAAHLVAHGDFDRRSFRAEVRLSPSSSTRQATTKEVFVHRLLLKTGSTRGVAQVRSKKPIFVVNPIRLTLLLHSNLFCANKPDMQIAPTVRQSSPAPTRHRSRWSVFHSLRRFCEYWLDLFVFRKLGDIRLLAIGDGRRKGSRTRSKEKAVARAEVEAASDWWTFGRMNSVCFRDPHRQPQHTARVSMSNFFGLVG